MEDLKSDKWSPETASNGQVTSQDYTRVVCYPSLQVTSKGVWFGENPLHHSFPLLLMQTSTMIIVSRVVQILLRPLRQPTIVSDLLAGVLLGPSGLGQFPTIHEALFPERGIFISQTLSTFAVIYHLFSIGVKVNLRLLSKNRKVVVISLTTLFFPFATVLLLSQLLEAHASDNFAGGIFLIGLATGSSVTAFAVLFPILLELGFLSTELGRISLSIAALQDVLGLLSATFLMASDNQTGEIFLDDIVYKFCTLVFLTIFSCLIIRPMLFRLIQRTPQGKPVDQGCVLAILVGALALPVGSHILGLNIIQASIIFGIAIPDGPPLGSTITEKIDTVDRILFQPVFYLGVGRRLNALDPTIWTTGGSHLIIFLANRAVKLAAALVSAMACRMPFHDGLCVGLLLNIKGFLNFLYFIMWKETGMVSTQSYAGMILLSLATNMVVTPTFTYLMKKSRPYMPYARRTIQHSNNDAELSLLTCIHDEENIAPILNLVEVTNATRERPICIRVMHLVELVGRATPMLIAHKPDHNSNSTKFSSASSANVFSAFRNYARHRDSCVALQLFTCISPSKTMHEDICSVALQKRVSLIILPFHKRRVMPSVPCLVNHVLQVMNPNVVAQAPCSVGILVERAGFHAQRFSWAGSGTSLYRVGVIFLGGPDDRESLSYAARMVQHPSVVLKVVRFLAKDQSGQDPREKHLDDDLMSEFQMNWMGNRKVVYQEEQVHDGEDVLNVIRSMDNVYDLVVVGRRHTTNWGLIQGLSAWIESPELGVMGDLCSSSDFFGGVASVLVMQQQAMTSVGSQKNMIYEVSVHTSSMHDMPNTLRIRVSENVKPIATNTFV
ncbi:hypothetical protein ACLOJK_031369 [Asimina triloba]